MVDRPIACTVQPQPTYNNSSDPKRRAQSQVTCLTQSQQKRSTMSSSHMSPRSRTTNSISPRGKSPKPSKTPIGYSIGNGNHRPSRRNDKMERKKTFSAMFANLVIRPADWGPVRFRFSGKTFWCKLQQCKFPSGSDIGGQGVVFVRRKNKVFLARPRGDGEFRHLCGSLERESLPCLRLSVPVWADALLPDRSICE